MNILFYEYTNLSSLNRLNVFSCTNNCIKEDTQTQWEIA